MPNFYKKEYNGLSCELVPTNLLRKGWLRRFPFIDTDTVKLRIKVKSINPEFKTKLKDLPIRYRYPSGKVESLYGHTKLSDETSEWVFESAQLPSPSSGSLEYWIDNPDNANSVKLAELNKVGLDQIWVLVIGALLGAILSLLSAILLGIVQISPTWIVHFTP